MSGERIPIREVQPPWGPSPNVAVYLYVKASDIEAIVRRVVYRILGDVEGDHLHDLRYAVMCAQEGDAPAERPRPATGEDIAKGVGVTETQRGYRPHCTVAINPRDIPESGTQIINVCATCGEVARLKRIEVAARNLEKALAHWRPWRNGDYIEALAAFRKALEAK